MKYIYMSCYLPEKYLAEYVDNNKVNLAAQKYHKLMIEGLINNDVNVSCISLIPINRSNSSYNIIHHIEYGNERFIIPTMINFPILKQISLFISCIKLLFSESRKEDIGIIIDGLNITASLAALTARKRLNAKCLGIITDMPSCLADNSLKIIRKINQYVLKKFNYYVFLTNYMNNFIKAEADKYIVLEGQVDANDTKKTLVKRSALKIILYSGSIHKIYGISNLVDGFLNAELKDYELHIYGDGDYAEELSKIAIKNNKIKYFGVVSNEDVLKKQKEAYLLVNPRPISYKYTIYSFPSKTLEYMNSGTAMITTKLPGIPDEYMDHIFTFPEDTVDGIKKGLETIAEMDEEDVVKKGKEAQEFVRKEKSKERQAQKMILLFEKNK